MQSQQKRPNYDRFEAFLPGIGIGIPVIGLRLFFSQLTIPKKESSSTRLFQVSVNFIVIRPQLNTAEHRYKHFYWMFKWKQLLSSRHFPFNNLSITGLIQTITESPLSKMVTIKEVPALRR